MQEINLITPINKLSFGRVGINLLVQLKKLGVKVNLLPITSNLEFEEEEKEVIFWGLENSKTTEINADTIKIWHPNDCSFPEILTGRKFIFTFFELINFTEQEKQQLSSVNIINCTKWAERICHENGLANTVGIVNLGYDPKIFYCKERPKNDLFTVFNCGKAEIRKGHDIIPDIFSLAFSKNEPVKLTLCFDNPFYSEGEMNSWYKFYKKRLSGFNLEFIKRTNTQKELANVMQYSDCGLFPARSEAWNLDLLEMLACNIPCVTTKYAGHTEFIIDGVIPSETELAMDGKWFFSSSKWAKITDENIAQFAHQLKELYWMWLDNKSGSFVDVSRFTWENSAKQLLEILNGNSNFST